MGAFLIDRFRECFSLRFLSYCIPLLMASFLLPENTEYGQLEFERAPIAYHKATVNDPIAKLQQRIDHEEVSLRFDEKHGYLPDVLTQLGISQSSWN